MSEMSEIEIEVTKKGTNSERHREKIVAGANKISEKLKNSKLNFLKYQEKSYVLSISGKTNKSPSELVDGLGSYLGNTLSGSTVLIEYPNGDLPKALHKQEKGFGPFKTEILVNYPLEHNFD